MFKEEKELYEFGEFRLEVAERLLVRLAGERVPLSEKAFQTLCVLVRNAGRLLTKDRLLNEVWADAFVEENNLDKCIYAIRQALGEKPGEQKFIETVRKHGYRFVADVRRIDEEEEKKIVSPADSSSPKAQRLGAVVALADWRREADKDESEEVARAESVGQSNEQVSEKSVIEKTPVAVSRSDRKKNLLVGAIGLSLILLGFGYFALTRFRSETAAKDVPIDSIAVMPFVNESGSPELEYLSDGMTETLINSLSQLPNLAVKARSSIFRYKGVAVEPQTVGSELNVQAVLSGRVVQIGENLILYLSLVDTRTGDQIWGEQYNRKQADLISLQTEIARDVSSKLKTKLSGADKQRLSKTYTENPEAYRLYLLGRFYWNKRTVKDFQKSVEYYEQAITLDRNFALPYAGIADSYVLIPNYGGPAGIEVMTKAQSAALKALSLDNELPEAHAALGVIMTYGFYDFAGAEREFKRAIELNPNYAMARNGYGILLSRLGRHEESLAEHRRALEIEPFSIFINRTYGESLLYARRYDEALEQLKKAIELDANFPVTYPTLSITQQMKGNYAESVEAVAKFRELVGSTETATLMRESYARGGWEGFLRAMTGKNRPAELPPYIAATYLAALGEKDRAFEELYKAYENRQIIQNIKVDPRLDSLRDDPRFQDLIQRVGFAP